MKLTPAVRLYGLGAILFTALAICSRKFEHLGEPSFLIWLGVAGIAYLFAVRELFAAVKIPRQVIVVGLVLAAAWHVLFLLKPAGADDDVRRYLWDGRVQRLGYNPYVVIPADPALAAVHTAETRGLNHPELPSPYPPGAELFFRGVTGIRESVFTLKVAFVLCDVAIGLVLLAILRASGQPMHWALVFAWHPLLATEVAGSGHVDILGALLLLVSFAALGRRWRAVAAAAFALAVAVKFLPIVLVPLYWRRLRIRDALLGVFVFAALYLPFVDRGWNRGWIPTGSLGRYVHSFRFNGPVFAMLERVLAPELLVALAAIAGFAVAIWLRGRSVASSADPVAWPMATSLLCAPVVYPWYMLWLLPFLRPGATVPLLVWTISILPTYYVWHLRRLGRPWVLPVWVTLLEYGALAAAAVVISLRSRKAKATGSLV